ncbi:hypothetical protein SAMN06295987_10775 [Novosphingobium mathurense]|uniref:Uncharacterized protein n=2 Tax=Novosphingobium mathurense TaxID=428990 RepID=A0A1U6IIT8_9SPHN|nr:hypothetical protein SAMN06295987_10775 [Novosphingobium mathurense]
MIDPDPRGTHIHLLELHGEGCRIEIAERPFVKGPLQYRSYDWTYRARVKRPLPTCSSTRAATAPFAANPSGIQRAFRASEPRSLRRRAGMTT